MPPVSAQPGPRLTSLGPPAQSQPRVPTSFWCTRTAQRAHSSLCKVPLVVMNHSLSPWTPNSCLLLLSSNHHKNSPVCSLSSPAAFDIPTQIPKPSPRSLQLQPAHSKRGPQCFVSPTAPLGLGFLLSTYWIPTRKCNRKNLKAVSSICLYSQWDC